MASDSRATASADILVGAGTVGADDPLLAFEDAVREFEPDHILIGLRAAERSGWQERGLLDQVIARFGVPVTVFQLGES